MASSTTDVEMTPVEEQSTEQAAESTVESVESSDEKQSKSTLKEGFRRYNLLDMVEEATVDEDGKQIEPPKFKLTKRVFTARTPHAAAKKVANRGLTVIYLQEVNTKGKGLVHHFHGTKRPLQGKEITEYSKKIGANHKAIVKKQGTIRLVKKGSRKNKNQPQKKDRKAATSKKVAAAKRQASSKKTTKKASAAAKKAPAAAAKKTPAAAAKKTPAAATKKTAAAASTKKAPASIKKAAAASTKRGAAAATKKPVAVAAK